MNKAENRLEKLLVSYYGLLQIGHIIGLIISGAWWLRNGELGALAMPPQGGWEQQTIHFLVATGMFDLLIAVCAIFFVYQYRRGRKTSDILGSIALTGSLYSAVIYAYGTIRSGAWSEHLLAYGVISVLFAPMVALAFLFLARRIWKQ
ncbi:MAG: hypothetical protein PVI81_09325 [Anaerolineales bacterium]